MKNKIVFCSLVALCGFIFEAECLKKATQHLKTQEEIQKKVEEKRLHPPVANVPHPTLPAYEDKRLILQELSSAISDNFMHTYDPSNRGHPVGGGGAGAFGAGFGTHLKTLINTDHAGISAAAAGVNGDVGYTAVAFANLGADANNTAALLAHTDAFGHATPIADILSHLRVLTNVLAHAHNGILFANVDGNVHGHSVTIANNDEREQVRTRAVKLIGLLRRATISDILALYNANRFWGKVALIDDLKNANLL